ncbi:GDP-mannose-dependent alpha-(1-6)-phosphatidylinositol monomannoside mannosyltransferase [Pedobacter sp. Bi27]|uniref:glycosyltransferase family 4 protein n=1 Tax=Pedobacter sp. Bi27 TaxID=2822351 RepID=UPI001D3E27A7|nr:glycosyltransferase family 4 protein [Pedobacter sp. Bi27]CAH0166441.1 GDP-mannose-dependent alpha-(1-6)-phosphatidylinositol monomannoside mannosyltransferase [Pedobacter sp. Bi27]
MPVKVLFLTLKTFSLTGGIEKVCRTLCRVLYDLSEDELVQSTVYSMYDKNTDRDSRYLSKSQFRGFAGRKEHFVVQSFLCGLKADVILLSHIHLINIVFFIKRIHPNKKIYLLAHGIEVWKKLSDSKLKMLNQLDKIICVSKFTADKIMEMHQIPADRIEVLNNCLDPFYHLSTQFEKPQVLLNRYNLNSENLVLFSLSRLSSSEKYKGYDHTIELLPKLLETYPNLIYLLGGKWDTVEKRRLDELIAKNKLQNHIKMVGFIDEAELTEHFLLSDIFILPSKKEGFGIVFIEALASGLRVIAGNKDGSVDALRGGALGVLVDPDDQQEMLSSICHLLRHTQTDEEKKNLQEKCMQAFSYNKYLQSIKHLLLAEQQKKHTSE